MVKGIVLIYLIVGVHGFDGFEEPMWYGNEGSLAYYLKKTCTDIPGLRQYGIWTDELCIM